MQLKTSGQITHFIGRQDDLDKVSDLLANPACRLLALIGVGGIGKTRLALQVAEHVREQFADGAHWVNLQPLQSGDYLIPAIADAVGATLSGQELPQQQLCRYLEPRHQLLVLDNFEHLIEHANLLSEIVQHTPEIKLLVTSREALNLQEEWLYPLRGLSLPSGDDLTELEMSDAIRLFVERAQQVRRDFSLEDEQAGVVRICQLVEGMPLAIEMAAAWTKSLRCSIIADEIEQNVRFLTSRLRNVPERHRSMEAMLTQTWGRLTGEEQALFKRLSVFRGGFQSDAAQAIADASLPLLASLVDKSLVRRDPNDRYHLHELLRQYAERQLTPEEAQQIEIAHCLYFADFLDRRRYHFVQGEQVKINTVIEAELENIRAAWKTAIDKRQVQVIGSISNLLFQFGQFQSRYLEIVGMLEQALPILEAENEMRWLAQVEVDLSWMLIRVSRLERVAVVLEQSRSLFETLDITPPYGMGTHPLAPSIILYVLRGQYAEALEFGEKLVRESNRFDDQHNLAFAYYGLTSAYFNLGDYAQAYDCARQAVTLAEGYGSRWFMAYCLNEWGRVARTLGKYDEAETHYRASYQIRQSFRDPEGKAVVLNHLGELALLREDYEQAYELYDESLSIYQNLNDQGGLASAHQGLGQVAAQTGKIAQAIHHLTRALAVACGIHLVPRILSILVDVGGLFLRSEPHTARSLEILTVVLRHPASSLQQREHVAELLGNRQWPAGAPLVGLDELLPGVRMALATFTLDERAESAEQPLVNALTERELEILNLLVSGMSNPEIGKQLFITVGTVKAHTSRIYSKLGVRNRVEAIGKARELALLGD